MAPAPMIVVAGLAVRDGLMLVQRRPQGKLRPGLWEHPGGKVDPGEHLTAALAREWREELYDARDGHGLQIAGGIGNRITTVHFTVERPIELSLYHVELPPDIANAVRPREADDLVWIDPLHAVETLPLSPGSYLLYPWIRGFVSGDWSLVPASYRFGASAS